MLCKMYERDMTDTGQKSNRRRIHKVNEYNFKMHVTLYHFTYCTLYSCSEILKQTVAHIRI